MPDPERLERLRQGFSKWDSGKLRVGESKLGEGLDNIVVGPGFIESNQRNPLNPGFRFGAEGAKLRTADKLTITSDFDEMYVDNGIKRFNPITGPDHKASAVTDPKPNFIYDIPLKDSLMMMPQVTKVLEALRAAL